MKQRYWLFQRPSGIFYIQDRITKRQESLKTRDKIVASRLFHARNEAWELPTLNAALASAYLTGASVDLTTRTWNAVFDDIEAGCRATSSKERWQKMRRSEPFHRFRRLTIQETTSQHFLRVLRHSRAGNSTHSGLRTLHNRALDLGWLLKPILPARAWPKTQKRQFPAISLEEHRQVLEQETDEEFKLFYQMLWLTGGSQGDIANLHRDNVDMAHRRLTYKRMKLEGKGHGGAALVVGPHLEELLSKLPSQGWLFPTIRRRSPTDRSSRFWKLCRCLKFKFALHSYRYAWAERAKTFGMPIREAMAHFGHQSRAVHHAYAEKAEDVIVMPLEYYEEQRQRKIVQFQSSIDDPPQSSQRDQV